MFMAGLIIPACVFSYYSKRLAVFFKQHWQKDEPTFWRFLYVYASVFILGTPIVVIFSYIRQKLGLFCREWITRDFLDNYFKNRAYYALTDSRDIDNPDQRISENLKDFTVTSLNFLLIILGALIDLIAFIGILWSISMLLCGILLVYAVSGTLITIFIGKRLVGLNFNQIRKEADFRYGLAHIRDNPESIAFYQGEKGKRHSSGLGSRGY